MRLKALLLPFVFVLAGACASLAAADSSPPKTDSLKGRLAALGLDCRGGSPFSVKGALVGLDGASVSVNVTDGTFAGKQVSVTVVPDLTRVVRVGGGSPAVGDRALASGKICKAADGQRLVAGKVYTKAAGGDSKTQPAPTTTTTTTTTAGSGDTVPFACDGKGSFELKGLFVAASADAVALNLEGRQVSLALVAGWTQITRHDHSISAGDLIPGERLYAVGRACGSGDGARLVARKLVSLGVEPPRPTTTVTTTTTAGDAVPFACDGKGSFTLKGTFVGAGAGSVALNVVQGSAAGRDLGGKQASLALVSGWTQVTRHDQSISTADLVPGEVLYALGRACASGDGFRLVASKLIALGTEPAKTGSTTTATTETSTAHTEASHTEPAPTEPARTETTQTETSGTTTHA